MHIDFLAEFPIAQEILPVRLRELLEPVSTSPDAKVEVAAYFEVDKHGPAAEHVHMLMAAVPESIEGPLPVFDEAGHGVVAYSVPAFGEKGGAKGFAPSVSGYEPIVASWGDGSYYTYFLSEKVWMALGLSARCIGNTEQRVFFDDLSVPEFSVAEGEVSRSYFYSSSRNVSWRMSNEYLRRHLWMRGARAVRSFFYQKHFADLHELREVMKGERHVEIKSDKGWYLIDLREHDGGILVQVWATVEAIPCQRCEALTADGLEWPGVPGAVTHVSANAIVDGTAVYLDDAFLNRYEQSAFYNSVPVNVHGTWHCSPSYRGQWSFSECQRVGRNLIRVSIRELYKPKPDREILHARRFALPIEVVGKLDLGEEHIVAKTQRLLDQILQLGQNLAVLGRTVGLERTAAELVGISPEAIRDNGWIDYPQICRLSQVAPLAMSQQEFLARCKSLHEFWQKVPSGFLKSLLEIAGCPRSSVRDLGSLKLLQALMNIVEPLNEAEEASDAFRGKDEPEGWSRQNAGIAPLFVLHDLRIADAHDTFAQSLRRLQDLGFDLANLHQGYGLALDFVMDQVIESFSRLNLPLSEILAR